MVQRKVNEEDDVLVVNGNRVNQGSDMCKPDDRTIFSRTKMKCNPCDLSQARGVRPALVNKLYCTDVYCGCLVYNNNFGLQVR